MKRPETPRPHLEPVYPEACDGKARLCLLGDRHLLEILGAQDFQGRMRESRVEIKRPRFLLAPAPAFHLVEHRFGEAPEAGLLGLLISGPRDLLEHQLHQLFQHLRFLPEDMESLIEDLLVLAPLYEDGMQRPVEILARSERAGLRRIERVDHLAGPDRPARL